jgi:hypothetical protein
METIRARLSRAMDKTFSLSQTATGFLRFNVAQSADERIFEVLEAAMQP